MYFLHILFAKWENIFARNCFTKSEMSAKCDFGTSFNQTLLMASKSLNVLENLYCFIKIEKKVLKSRKVEKKA